jgi:flavin-dependent dehydrogenase
MIDSKVIIIGGGPAGSTCAWKLNQSDISTIVLDKSVFPRPKTCAGWLPPVVLKDLCVEMDTYPHGISTFRRLNYHFWGYKIPVRTRQHSIRRYEFDNWLLRRSGARVVHHKARHIHTKGGRYVIDDSFRCEYLVGAGGTNCIVYRTLFQSANPRIAADKLVALEEEFPYKVNDKECHLWFFDDKLPGYAWYVPKANGYVNVGVGGKYLKLKQRGQRIFDHWDRLVQKLEALGLVQGRQYNPRGCAYYLRRRQDVVHMDKTMIVGDAAGLATTDMGEGIGPAVKSGILAADAITKGHRYSTRGIERFSLRNILMPG